MQLQAYFLVALAVVRFLIVSFINIDLSGAKPRSARSPKVYRPVGQFVPVAELAPPVFQPVSVFVSPPTEVIEQITLVAEFGNEPEPPVEELVVYAEPEPIEKPQVVSQPAPILVPIKTPEQMRGEVMEYFREFLEALSENNFAWAERIREDFKNTHGDRTRIDILAQIFEAGGLDTWLFPGLIFRFMDRDGAWHQVSSIEDVPAKPSKKRALSLLWALFEKTFPRKTISFTPRTANVFTPTAPSVMRPGKTERDKAKKRGPRPVRVGPAKGNSPGKKRA